jgi:REP element-mobilizing transposase RayT
MLPPMARKLRVEYPGAIYHVMNRGDRREAIFRDDGDRQRFLDTLGEACGKAGWQVHALCLMHNHFHLVVETPRGDLVAGMKWFLGTYTSRFNRRHRLFGHLFSGRYKALIVDGSGDGYLKTVCDYVHLNPARAELVRQDDALSVYGWSSWPQYLMAPRKRWPWLRVDRLLGEYRIGGDSAAGRRRLEEGMERRRSGEDGREFKAVRRGWCLGGSEFRRELLEQMAGGMGEHHDGEERWETAEAVAERIVGKELARLGWSDDDLANRSKGDSGKVATARRLRKETTMTLKWIAQRLAMGSASMVSHCLRFR